MRDRICRLWRLAVVLALLVPCAAHAAGLGRLAVLSALGQPLDAEIELLSVQKGETITARLAPPEVYQQAGAQYNNALTGARVTVERRPNGDMYLKATTPRPINDPFVELLIEMNSENGRVVRQYTLLLDPPGYGRAAGEIPPPARPPEPAPPVAAAPPAPVQSPAPPATARAVTPPPAPVAEGPLPVPRERPGAAARKPAPAPAEPAKQYGPVKPGETLASIARNVKPESVSLEQTLVGLYRHNPDAFIKQNMNLLRSGKILRVPEAQELSAMPPSEARQEVRTQVADFNAYRNRVADRAASAPEEGSVRSGRIGSRVADRSAAEGPRDTVRISRGEPPGKGGDAASTSAAERIRALEEEAIAREKALAEANERIAHLEQIIKDTQRAMELKSAPGAAAGKGAEKSAVSAQPSSPVALAPSAAAPGQPEGAKPAAEAAKAPKAADASAPAPAPKADAPADAKKKAAQPEPATEPSFVERLFEEPLYLAAGGAVVLLGGLGLMIARRRRHERGTLDDDYESKTPPTLGDSTAGADREWSESVIERP